MIDQTDRADRHDAARLLCRARRTGRHADALFALAAHPESRAARRLAARTSLRAGDPALAESLLTQGLLRDPGDPGLLRLRATCRMRRGAMEAARSDLLHALDRDPLHASAHLSLARLSRRQGHLESAEEHLAFAQSLSGRTGPIAREAARQALAKGEANRGLRLLPRDERGNDQTLRLRLLLAAGRWAEAHDLAELIATTGSRRARARATEILCRSGDRLRLRRLLSDFPRGQSESAPQRLQVLLALGEARSVICEAFPLRRGAGEAVALTLLATAALQLDRSRLARLAIARLRTISAPPPPLPLRARWLARARFVERAHETAASSRAMVDPGDPLLPRLLAAA